MYRFVMCKALKWYIVHKKIKALVVYTISLINLLLLLALKKTNRTSMHTAWCNASTCSYQFKTLLAVFHQKTASSILQIFHFKIYIYISSWFFFFQDFIPSIILLVSFLLDGKDVKVVLNHILILCQPTYAPIPVPNYGAFETH